MAIQFNPPEWLIQEYMNRKQPAEVASEGIGGALQTYAQLKQQKQAQDLQKKQADLLALKEAREGREQFYNYGDIASLSPEQQAQINAPTQGPVTEAGVAPAVQKSPIIQHFESFLQSAPQGIKGREKQLNTANVPIYDAKGNIINTVPYNAKPAPAASATAGMGKPPTGFRWTADGNLEAIPGGPAGIKIDEKEKKEKGLLDASIRQADIVVSKVDQALNNVSGWSTGWGSKILGDIPGTSAINLKKDIDTLKANLGFATLQEMRRNSPTGGALGQVAVQELEMLQSTVASLDPEQSDDQIVRNLNEVKQHYENWRKAAQGQETSGPAQGALPIGTIQKGYRFKGGNPSDKNSWEKI